MRAAHALALDGAAVLMLAACSGRKSADSAGEVDTTPPATRSTAATATAAQLPCSAGALRLVERGADVGAGNRAILLSLVNRGTEPCTARGYPSVSLIDSAGAVIPGMAIEQAEGSYFTKERPVGDVALAPGAAADFEVTFGVVPGEPGGCPTGAALEIALSPAKGANDTTVVVIGQLRIPVRACGARLRVTPLAPHIEAKPE